MERVSYKSYREYFKEREEKRIKDITDKMTHQEMLISPNGTYTKHWSYKNDPFLYPYELDDKYCYEDCMTTLKAYHNMAYGYPKPNDRIEKVIFNNPATIVIWADGTKTIIKCDKEDEFDPEKGLAMAIAKKYLGTNKTGSNYYDVFEKWVPKKEKKVESDIVVLTTNKIASEMIDRLVENATTRKEETNKNINKYLLWIRKGDRITFRDGHTERADQYGTLGLLYDEENIIKIERYDNDESGEIIEKNIFEEETDETI